MFFIILCNLSPDQHAILDNTGLGTSMKTHLPIHPFTTTSIPLEKDILASLNGHLRYHELNEIFFII